MTQQIQRKLSESKTARWSVLALVAFTMLCGYFITDMMAPLQDLLQTPVGGGGLGWSGDDYGKFTSAYGWFNVFFLMLIFGGMILDKMGVRFTGLMATCIMIVGVFIKWFGISNNFDGATVTIFGTEWGYTLLVASLGYAIFGVGVEIAGITVSKIIVKWFKGKEMALAMGLEMACARIGTGLAIGITPLLCKAFNNSISMPILIGLILLCIGLLSFIVFVVMDKRRDEELENTEEEAEEPFRFSDIFSIISMKGFWYVALLCVLFYSAVFPFLKYAPSLMINKFGIDPEWSGVIPALLPFGNILLTPFFGNLYDRKGKGATIMIIGAIMLVFIHFMFSIPALNNWVIALGLILLLGIAFSLVPSAMWPSVPKIIPENKLGTAYALIFWVQNWGLMGVPYLIGKVLDKYCITGYVNEKPTYDYTIPMMIFTCFGILALMIALLLKREDRIKGYGLELPNIKKPEEEAKIIAEEMIAEP
ncbi:MFS transporter [Parabacteroides provencensis]|uniref:MFS transporter n=1 Tax=Parabacteroides provencensis TaxID=1944636 RepID=UPI000C14BD20|nr:MFS transporter [Parabacteroides provencensis]